MICNRCQLDSCSYEPHSIECQSARVVCDYCENEIYRNDDGEFFLEVETNHWDYHYDGYEKVELWGIKYCPYCGRKLGD